MANRVTHAIVKAMLETFVAIVVGMVVYVWGVMVLWTQVYDMTNVENVEAMVRLAQTARNYKQKTNTTEATH
jgi:hypothetical protein